MFLRNGKEASTSRVEEVVGRAVDFILSTMGNR